MRHIFDGKRYVERERMPADKAPEGKGYLAGELDVREGHSPGATRLIGAARVDLRS